jgi:hypothetical protein
VSVEQRGFGAGAGARLGAAAAAAAARRRARRALCNRRPPRAAGQFGRCAEAAAGAPLPLPPPLAGPGGARTSFSVSVVLPASGWEMIAKFLRRLTSRRISSLVSCTSSAWSVGGVRGGARARRGGAGCAEAWRCTAGAGRVGARRVHLSELPALLRNCHTYNAHTPCQAARSELARRRSCGRKAAARRPMLRSPPHLGARRLAVLCLRCIRGILLRDCFLNGRAQAPQTRGACERPRETATSDAPAAR